MSNLERAIEIAAAAHAGQIDKSGQPYILHPIRVMLHVRTLEQRITAMLHDVVEDTHWTIEQLAEEGFSTKVLGAVLALTKLDGESRLEAAHRARQNPIARRVKLADVADNMDWSRINNPTKRDMVRMEEYKKVREVLLKAEKKVDEAVESPLLGPRFYEAFKLASDLHCRQERKGAPVPYISHLMAVAGIVLEANGHFPVENIEDVAIGALLHDAVEDQGHQIGLDEIKERFGETVYRIVLECSDAIVTTEGQKKPFWKERKKKYIANVASKSRETLLVSCADKIHNARTTLFDFNKVGGEIWSRFNGGKDGTVWYYESLAAEFEKAWPENPLLPEFRTLVQQLRNAADST